VPVEVLTGFDGSSPQIAEGVRREATDRFVLVPGYGSREGTSQERSAGGARFYTRLSNRGAGPACVTVVADWQTPGRAQNFDYGYVRHETDDEWTQVPAVREEARATYALELRPGLTELGALPGYNYETCCAFVDRMRDAGVAVRTIGQSREGRDLHLLHFPSPNPGAKPFFLQARDHPYETAGNFCAEGVAQFLLSDDPVAAYLRTKYAVWLAPMTNPDGVVNGLSRLTWEQGANMNREVNDVSDPAHDALKGAIDAVRPFVHMNVHNWTYRFRDGLLCNEEGTARRIQEHMPADAAHYKRWRVQTAYDFLREGKLSFSPDASRSWKNYCKNRFGAQGCTFEFPWFGLSTADMRDKGRRAFAALGLAVIEEEDL